MIGLTIDTLSVAQQLRKYGFTAEQATGGAEALKEIDATQLVTKSDLKEPCPVFKADSMRRLVFTQIALAGFIFAAMKLSK